MQLIFYGGTTVDGTHILVQPSTGKTIFLDLGQLG
jgi:hypothetical protein